MSSVAFYPVMVHSCMWIPLSKLSQGDSSVRESRDVRIVMKDCLLDSRNFTGKSYATSLRKHKLVPSDCKLLLLLAGLSTGAGRTANTCMDWCHWLMRDL